MPHCVIEHAKDVLPEPVLKAVFEGALASNLFAEGGKDIKVRAVPVEHFVSGGEEKRFVHVALKILSGRTLEQKQTLSNEVLNQLKALPLSDISLTVEVIDIDRESYAKEVVITNG